MSKKVVLSAFLIAIVVYWAFPISRSEGIPDFPRRPKLLLILAIDQLRYDYLVRFRPQFVERGFSLLLNGGANFVNCRYDSTVTDTGPGHAALLTGAYGNVNGIPANEWYDRALRRPAYCVEDPTAKLVGEPEGTAAEPGFSPRNLIGSTVGDELRAETSFQSQLSPFR